MDAYGPCVTYIELNIYDDCLLPFNNQCRNLWASSKNIKSLIQYFKIIQPVLLQIQKLIYFESLNCSLVKFTYPSTSENILKTNEERMNVVFTNKLIPELLELKLNVCSHKCLEHKCGEGNTFRNTILILFHFILFLKTNRDLSNK